MSAGTALQELKADYEDSNVLFIEQDVDAPLGGRVDRWFQGYGQPGTVYLPLTQVDSGHDVSAGSVNYISVYSDMVDTSLPRAPKAQMTVTSIREGNLLRFSARITNTSGATLSAANNASITALVYEEPQNSSSVPLVRAAGTAQITTLVDGGTGDYAFEIMVGTLDPDRTRWVVIADYRPDTSASAYDTLQAVVGP
jgi:hypothetical protein